MNLAATILLDAVDVDKASIREYLAAREIVSAMDEAYGVVGDDSADDAAGLRAAFAEEGLWVFLPTPPVAYKIASNLVAPKCAAIVGTGREACRIHAAAGVTKALPLDSSSLCTYVAHFGIDGNGTDSARGIVCGDGGLYSYATFENVAVEGFTGTGAVGWDFRDAVAIDLRACVIMGSKINVRFDSGVVSGCPTTVHMYGGCVREALSYGVSVVQALNCGFHATIFEANQEEAARVETGVGKTVFGLLFDQKCHFEDNWKSLEGSPSSDRHAQYQLVADGSAATSTTRLTVRDSHFVGNADTAKSMHLFGATCAGVISNTQVPSLTGEIRLASSASFDFHEWPTNLEFETVVEDPGGLANNDALAFAPFVAFTPTYSSIISGTPTNAAGTFSGAVTTGQMRFKRIGKQVVITLNVSFTLLGVTPSAIVMSLPGSIVPRDSTTYSAVKMQVGGTEETGSLQTDSAGNITIHRNNSVNFSSGAVVSVYGQITYERA